MTNKHSSPAPDPAFNHDLFIHRETHAHLRDKYPHVFHVLFDEGLVETFCPIDRDANAQKKGTHRAGLWSISCAGISLGITAASPLLQDLPAGGARYLAVGAAALGICAAFIGKFGLLLGVRKKRWLLLRLKTERLRQLHFQEFVSRLPEICDSVAVPPDRKKSAEDSFTKKRAEWRAELMAELGPRGENELAKIISKDRVTDPDVAWLHPKCDAVAALGRIPADTKRQLLDAYAEWRIGWQEGYALEKSRAGGALEAKLKRVEGTWICLFVAILMMHALLLGHGLGIHIPAEESTLHTVLLVTALAALVLHKVREGLRLDEEMARYREYLSDMGELRIRFSRAKTDAEYIDVMQETEAKAFAEMRQFLRAHNDATFVL